MVKWLCIIIRALPAVISCLIKCKHMNRHKDNYDLENRTKVVKKMLHAIVRATNTKIEIEGKEYLQKPENEGRVYFINHNSIFDALAIFEITDNPLIFISKIENSNTPFLKTICTALDVLMIDRQNLRQSLKTCKTAGLLCANDKNDVVIFPEGTRSKDGDVHEFKAAFASIVHYSQSSTIMISMYGTKNPLSWKWFTYPKNIVKIKVFEPVSYSFYVENKHSFNDHARQVMQSFVDENKKVNA